LSLDYGINNPNGQVSLENSHQILDYAFDQGILVLDTAEAYGNAHQVVGDFHRKHTHKKFEIITKLPHHFDENIVDKVNQYLNDLSVNSLHAIMFHSFDSYNQNKAKIKLLNDMKSVGKIQKIGVSVYTNQEVETVLLDNEIEVIQLPFNLLDNINLRGEIIKKAADKGKIIHTRSALLQGLFFKDPNATNKVVQNLKSQLLEIHKISKNNDIPMQQLALNYCLQQSNIQNVLIGVDSIEQMAENILALNKPIAHQIIQQIDKILVKDVNLLNPSLWH